MSEEDMDLNELFEITPNENKTDATPNRIIDSANDKPNKTSIKNPQRSEQNHSYDEVTYSPSRTNNYRTIRILSSIFKGLAVISLAAGILAVFGLVAELSSARPSNADALVYGVGIFYGLSSSALFALFSEGINLFVDLEANTRQTAKTLERLLRSQG